MVLNDFILVTIGNDRLQVFLYSMCSENMTLQPQDEIESAHWTQKQVTLFPIHIVCHAADSTKDKPLIVKESLIILSDGLTHNAGDM
jgi:hypothetical protein